MDERKRVAGRSTRVCVGSGEWMCAQSIVSPRPCLGGTAFTGPFVVFVPFLFYDTHAQRRREPGTINRQNGRSYNTRRELLLQPRQSRAHASVHTDTKSKKKSMSTQ